MSTPSTRAAIKALEKQLEHCMIDVRRPLRKRLRRLVDTPNADELARIELAIETSSAQRALRAQQRPQPRFADNLPVVSRREEIAEAIENNQVIILCGETGSGKTTQLPKICLALGRGVGGLIGHTQPRRIAARSVATRIAEELNTPIGEAVGFKIRFSDHLSERSYIKLMTDGILLAEIQHDRLLERYDTLIIDEAHERSLNIDFLLGYLKGILPKRPDLKLIVTSATIDPQRFATHFNNAPVIEVSGRTYPVQTRYRPLLSEDDEAKERDINRSLVEAVDELHHEGGGDILVFLPGEREIREAAEALRKHHPKGLEILPLYARLSANEQNRVFQAHGARRVVLCTNVAETSLTVPGIHYVIDTGLARISRYSWRAKIQRLPIEPISQASADQRKGRCGRVADGICLRLYSAEDFDNRPAFTDPEVLRTNLASVILQMALLGLGEVSDFPFVEPPDSRLIKDGYGLLFELGAVDASQNITALGRKLAKLPIDPRLGRMLLAAQDEGALREVLIIVSALAAQDPRERPHELRQAAEQKHARFNDPQSDFLAYLNLWDDYHRQAQELSKNKLRAYCRENFLSPMRMREWHDTHQQLRRALHDMGIKENQNEADYAAIHLSLLSALLGHIGFKEEGHEYLGARNSKFMLFPGSALFKKSPKWVMAAELTQTTRLYARTAAKIEASWLEQLAPHLIKHHYYEPHWEKKPAQVAADDRLTLYGLIINPKKRVNFGRIKPKEAREIFIRHALVYGEYHCQAPFFDHNRALIDEIETLEAKSRRRDILVDEHTLFEFYDQRLPANIHSGAAFERWRKELEKNDARALFLEKDTLMRHQASEITETQFPETLNLNGLQLQLSYCFEPGTQEDGVTLTLPLAALNQVDAARCDWLVPGLLEEKIIALIKTLPKSLRRNFVPAPDFARAAITDMNPDQGELIAVLSHQLQRMTGVQIPTDAWAIDDLPAHLRMRYRLVDNQQQTLKTSRDLSQLHQDMQGHAEAVFEALPSSDFEREGLTAWDFDALPEHVQIDSHGVTLKGYPALVDQGTSVDLRLLDSPEKAQHANRTGLLRLVRLALPEQMKYLSKHLPDIQTLCLHFATAGTCQALKDDIVLATLQETFLGDRSLPQDKTAFEHCLQSKRGDLIDTANEICRLLSSILKEFHGVRKRLKGALSLSWIDAAADINDQLDHLIYPGFVSQTPLPWLREMPRYIKGIQKRLQDLEQRPDKDRRPRLEIQAHWNDVKHHWDKAQNKSEALMRYRWMLEELRVSLFAQELGTAMPISAKRLSKQKEAMLAELR